MRRGSTATLAITALALVAVSGSPPSVAAPPVAVQDAPSAVVPGCDSTDIGAVGDLDGDAIPEVVVGVPTYPGGGAVDVRFTRGGGAVLRAVDLGLTATSSADRFGQAVVVTELNGDRCADLVIGAPGHRGVGSVVVALGNPTGWSAATATRVPAPTSKAGADFGWSVTITPQGWAGGFRDVLVAGLPGYPVAGRASAGAVAAYVLTDGRPGAPWVATENTPRVAGVAEAGDRFGSVLARSPGSGSVLVGMPLEDVGSAVDAGSVVTLSVNEYGGWSGYVWSEATPGVPGVVEAGDRFGASVLELGVSYGTRQVELEMTVGIPGEDIAGVRDAGAVVSFVPEPDQFDSAALDAVLLHQGGLWRGVPVPGSNEVGDAFGSSIGYRKQARNTFGIVVGVPGEDVGRVPDAGELVVFETGAEMSGTMASLTESSPLFGGYVEAGDRFGSALAGGSYRVPEGVEEWVSRLVVGIPGEDVRGARDAGAVAWSDEQQPGGAVTLSIGERAGLTYGSVVAAPQR